MTMKNDLSFCPTPKALANFVVTVYAMKQVLPDMNDPAIKQILSHIGIVIGGGCAYDEATNELLCVAGGDAHRISLAPSAVEALRVHKSN